MVNVDVVVDNEMCVVFEFCVVEIGEVFEFGCVVDVVEVEVLGDVDELVVVLDVVESGVVLVVDFIDFVVVVVDFVGVVVEIVEIGLFEFGDDLVDVFEVFEGEDLEEIVVMRFGLIMLLYKLL